MENNKKELISWAIDKFKEKLKIVELRWNIFEKQPYFDYKVNISIENQTYEGRGINLSQKNALNAAIGEAIERYAVHFNKIGSSNGCAFHTNLDIATANAQNEILERHYVMLFTLGYWSHVKVSKSEYPQEISNLVTILESQGVEFDFYSLHLSNSLSIILCQANGLKSNKPFGLIFGSSCTSSQDKSLSKSFKEVLINVIATLNNNLTPMNYENFLNMKSHTPLHHLELYLDLNFSREYLNNRIFKYLSLEAPDLSLFKNQTINFPFDTLYFVVKSIHPSCISPHWGPMNNNYQLPNHNLKFPFVLP